MTKKRFIKLMMSQGASRNGARVLARWYNLRGTPYSDAYSAERNRLSVRISVSLNALKNGFLNVGEAVRVLGGH